MAHQAINTSLQCVATHSLLQYSLSQSLLSTAGLVQPARTQMVGLADGATLKPGVTFTSTSIPSSASATTSPADTVCPTSTARVEDEEGVSPVDVTMIGVLELAWRAEGTTLICSGGGAVAAARGLACRRGGAWACTICCSRGGGGVLCICCNGGGCRAEDRTGVCLIMILVTSGGFELAPGGG